MEKKRKVMVQLDAADHAKLLDLQVKFRNIKPSGRISQVEVIALCINLIHKLPAISKCKVCGGFIAGEGFCSTECSENYGRLNDSDKR